MGKEKKHGLLGKILIFFTQTPDFIWRKRTEKQKFDRRIVYDSTNYERCFVSQIESSSCDKKRYVSSAGFT